MPPPVHGSDPGNDNLDRLGQLTVQEADLPPCCPAFACPAHSCTPLPPAAKEQVCGVTAAAKGVRLPRRPGDPLLPYDMAGLTLAQIGAKYPRYVPRGLYAKVLGAQLALPSLPPLAALPPAVAVLEDGSVGDTDSVYGEAEGEEGDGEEDFFDALES